MHGVGVGQPEAGLGAARLRRDQDAEVGDDRRVRFEGQEWTEATMQERRAIIYAATNAIEELKEWIEKLQD